jgi:hypothetical protein
VNVVEIYILRCVSWKVRPAENISEREREEIKEINGEVNSTMIYCKNFCKCHNVPPVQ